MSVLAGICALFLATLVFTATGDFFSNAVRSSVEKCPEGTYLVRSGPTTSPTMICVAGVPAAKAK